MLNKANFLQLFVAATATLIDTNWNLISPNGGTNQARTLGQKLVDAEANGTITTEADDLLAEMQSLFDAQGINHSFTAADLKPEYQATGAPSGSGNTFDLSALQAMTSNNAVVVEERSDRAQMVVDETTRQRIDLEANADQATKNTFIEKLFNVLSPKGGRHIENLAKAWGALNTKNQYSKPVAASGTVVNIVNMKDAVYSPNSGIDLSTIYGQEIANAIAADTQGNKVRVETRRVTLRVKSDGQTHEGIQMVMTTPVKKNEAGEWIPMSEDFPRPTVGGTVNLSHYPTTGFYETRANGRDLALQYCWTPGFTMSATEVTRSVTNEELQSLENAIRKEALTSGAFVPGGQIPNHTPVVQ